MKTKLGKNIKSMWYNVTAKFQQHSQETKHFFKNPRKMLFFKTGKVY